MKRPVITGFFTGVIISGILISGTYVRRFLPDTFTANLLFLSLFFSGIVIVLWLSLHHYCKRSAVKWTTLTFTGTISSLIAAFLVSIYGLLYNQFDQNNYINGIMQFSGQTDVGPDEWLQIPARYAANNFRDLSIALFLMSLLIAAIYYVRNRNRSDAHHFADQNELIF